jgi:glycosyltransferase involved in cell wall biosynthesis
MRILYFSRDYTPHDHRFLRSLAETEHEVFYLRLEKRGHALEDRILPAGVKLVKWAGGEKTVHIRDYPLLLVSLWQVLRKVEPDIVHAGPIQSVALLMAMSGFHPLVTMSWGSDLLLDTDKSEWYRWATRHTLKNTDVLVGDCQAVKDKAIELRFPEERIVTFPWGIDLEQFSPGDGSDLRARRGWEDAFIVMHNRSWEPVYGVDVFAKAFTRAAQQRPELRLFLLGSGSMVGDIRRIFMGGGVIDQVHFGGQVKQEDLPDYYRASDLYVSASYSDGSSVSLMEALGCGLPALVSDIPGNREWVVEGEHGWLFPDGDVEALANGILNAVDQKEKLQEIGKKARQLAEDRADWPKNFEKLLIAYEMAVNIKGDKKQDE